MAKLRVAHIITQLELGGAQRNTLYTVTHLDTQRFEPCLIAGPGGILDDETRNTGIPTFFIPTLVRPIRPIKDVRALVAIYKLLRTIQPDIVHTHSSKAGILGRVAAYLAGVPVIVHTFHGFGFTPQQRRPLKWLFIGIEKLCAWMTTHLVRQECGIPKDAWVVAYVGNFKPQKNPLDLVRVAERVVASAPDTHFVLIGDGEQAVDVQSYVTSHGIENRVHVLGWRKRRDDIREVLKSSNCFLLTSLWEGLPRSLVETFAVGRPAVAYAVNGVLDILKDGENGFLIPPGEIEKAAEKVLWLKDHPEDAKRMGERGQRIVEKEFDIDLMVRQQEELYDKLFKDVPLKEHYKFHGSLT